jgi:hypothetical protein
MMRQNAVMGRVRRVDAGGMIFHVLNRANFRSRLFKKPAHYQDLISRRRCATWKETPSVPRW